MPLFWNIAVDDHTVNIQQPGPRKIQTIPTFSGKKMGPREVWVGGHAEEEVGADQI